MPRTNQWRASTTASLRHLLVLSACSEFSAAGRMHHDLKGVMEDSSLEHELIALANAD